MHVGRHLTGLRHVRWKRRAARKANCDQLNGRQEHNDTPHDTDEANEDDIHAAGRRGGGCHTFIIDVHHRLTCLCDRQAAAADRRTASHALNSLSSATTPRPDSCVELFHSTASLLLHPSNMSSSIVVSSLKSSFGDDLRRFPLVDGVLPPLEELRRQLADAYSLTESITIKFLDEEDEKVTVMSHEDLRAAVDISAAQGDSTVRLFIEASTVAPEFAAAQPQSNVVAPAAGDIASPSSELVLSMVQLFLSDSSVQLALPSVVCALLDHLTLDPTADIVHTIRTVVDAHPVVSQTPLAQFALRYLDAGRPYLERLLAPLRAHIAPAGPHQLARAKAAVHKAAPRALAKVSHVVQTRLTAGALDRAWSVLREWSTDPSRPLPLHQLKEAIAGRSHHAAAGDAIKRFFGRLFGRRSSIASSEVAAGDAADDHDDATIDPPASPSAAARRRAHVSHAEVAITA